MVEAESFATYLFSNFSYLMVDLTSDAEKPNFGRMIILFEV